MGTQKLVKESDTRAMSQSGSCAERSSGDILNGTEMSPEDGFDGVLIEPQNSGPTHLQAPLTKNVR